MNLSTRMIRAVRLPSMAHGSYTVSATAPCVALPPASMQSPVQVDGVECISEFRDTLAGGNPLPALAFLLPGSEK